jgi:hypothetical protein
MPLTLAHIVVSPSALVDVVLNGAGEILLDHVAVQDLTGRRRSRSQLEKCTRHRGRCRGCRSRYRQGGGGFMS